MSHLRNSCCCWTFLLLLSVTAKSSDSFPDLKDDSVNRIRRDLQAAGRDFARLNKPSRVEMTNMHYRIELLQKRCDRLGGNRNPETKQMLKVIRQFRKAVDERSRQEAGRRRTEKKPYVFDSISGPTMREGGHSDKGAQYLMNEVKQFVQHYRQLKHDKFSNNEVYLDHSRSYFERTIEGSIDTALRRIKKPKPSNKIYISAGGGIVLDNYSPTENLQWALNVARIAQYFEQRIGGSTRQWTEWQRQIRAIAASNRISLK